MKALPFEGPRGARADEIPALLELLNPIFRPATASMAQEHPYMYCAENSSNLRIMLDNGRPVSHFGCKFWGIRILGVPLLCCSVGGVGTHPDYRSRNLATTLIKDAEGLCAQKGADIIYVSGSRGLYVRNGYTKAGRNLVWKVDGVLTAWFKTSGFALREFQAADLPLLARCCAAEPVAYERPLEELRLLVEGRLARSNPDRFFWVERSGRKVAFLEIMMGSAGDELILWEYAGDRSAVAAGLAIFMAGQNSSAVTVPVLLDDRQMRACFEPSGFEPQVMDHIFEHTLKVPDFGGFMDKMRPALAKRFVGGRLEDFVFKSRDSGGAIQCKGAELPLKTPDAVAKLIFTGVEAEGLENCKAVGGAIGEFVRGVFPLPMVLPGMNYV